MSKKLERTEEQQIAARKHMKGLLSLSGEDADREGLHETPARVIRAMCYRGVRTPAPGRRRAMLEGLFLRDAAARMEPFTLIGLRPEIS